MREMSLNVVIVEAGLSMHARATPIVRCGGGARTIHGRWIRPQSSPQENSSVEVRSMTNATENTPIMIPDTT